MIDKNFFNTFILTILFFIDFSHCQSHNNSKTNDEILYNRIKYNLRVGRFNYVNQKIIENNFNLTRLSTITHELELLNNQFVSETIRLFALSNPYANITFYVLKQLWYDLNETTTKNNTITLKNFNDYCEIYHLFKERIFSLEHDDNYDNIDALIDKSKPITDDIRMKIINFSISHLKKELYDNSFNSILSKNISRRILIANESIFDQVICQLINETYNEINLRNLLKAMFKLQESLQQAQAMICIFDKLQKNLQNNLDGSMIYTYYLSKLLKSDDIVVLNNYKKGELNNIIKQLPSTVKNTYLSKRICIKNVVTEKYLSGAINYNAKMHKIVAGTVSEKIFTDLNGKVNTMPYDHKWISRPINEFYFQFINQKYNDESLYTDYYTHNNNKRDIYSLSRQQVNAIEKNDDLIDQLVWRIKLHQNNEITISNKLFNDEFICVVPDLTIFGTNGQQFKEVISAERDSDDKCCRWIVEDC